MLSLPRQRLVAGDQTVALLLCLALALGLLVLIAAPLAAMFSRAFEAPDGGIGLAGLQAVVLNPRIVTATLNSLQIGLYTVLITLPLAFLLAFTLTRSRVPGKAVLRTLALSPMLAPSLMPAISLVYLFGNQGLLKSWLGNASIYGPIGIVLGEVFYTLPHALLILLTALAHADGRLYEAAKAMGASRWRRLLTITLPHARYGLIAATMVVFTLAVTDFGVPKVIGGQTNVLALEAYKQVIGQQNFQLGAVVGLLLLVPALVSALVVRWIARGHSAGLSGRSSVHKPECNRWRDALLAAGSGGVIVALLAMLLVAVAASFMKLWPYNLDFTLAHYRFDEVDGGGWLAFGNSVQLSLLTAVAGTGLIFGGAYLIEKTRIPALLAQTVRGITMVPMAVPGMVLGLGYIFCFNHPDNPLKPLYGTMSILVMSTIAHFYTTAHLTLSTSLRQLDGEMEAVTASLRRPFWTTLWRITLPICSPALLDVARYLFVSAMTTVSCVIFLYTPDTVLASVAVLNMDDAGDIGPAAAMASLIVLTSLIATLLFNLLGWLLARQTQRWRQPG